MCSLLSIASLSAHLKIDEFPIINSVYYAEGSNTFANVVKASVHIQARTSASYLSMEG